MHRKLVLPLVVVAASIATSAGAQTSETTTLAPTEAAPARAAELTIGTGYTQGFGQLQKGGANNLNDVANAGIGFDLGVAYRVDPRWSVGVAGQYQQFSTAQADGKSARGMLANFDLTYHVRPFSSVDPFVRVGTGYRLLWENTERTHLYHGFDWLRAAVGVDWKSTADLAVGPIVGADLTTFLWDRSGIGPTSAIADPRLATYVYAGFQGRLDIGNRQLKSNTMTATR